MKPAIFRKYVEIRQRIEDIEFCRGARGSYQKQARQLMPGYEGASGLNEPLEKGPAWPGWHAMVPVLRAVMPDKQLWPLLCSVQEARPAGEATEARGDLCCPSQSQVQRPRPG